MRLISFLGLGEPKRGADGKVIQPAEYSYKTTTYRFNQDPETDVVGTSYVARAIAESYVITEARRKQAPLHHRVDEVFLLATEQAEQAHLARITAEFEQHQLPKPEIISVPFGANAEQQWEQFNAILEAIPWGADKKVVLDITHGFRSQPFFAAAVLNYVRATRSAQAIPEMRVLYGEYSQDKGISDVWDMTAFVKLSDWSNALQGFMKTGHGADLAELANKEDRQIRRDAQDERPQTLSALARSLKCFSDNIATVRVPELITGSGDGSAATVLQRIADSEAEVQRFFKPLYPVLEQLKAKLKPIQADSLFSSEGHDAMLALSKLYVDYERYPEASAVLREAWVSLYADPVEDGNNLLAKETRGKAEERWRNGEMHQAGGSGLGDKLSGVRNDIQHAGFNTSGQKARSLIDNLQSLITTFEDKLSDSGSNPSE